jgi:hypothetical protein
MTAVFIVMMPFVVHAAPYQISPNPNTGTIVARGSDAYNSDRPFFNDGGIRINNNGMLTNNSGGLLYNEATLTNNGTLNNNYLLINEKSLSTLTNYGTLTTSGGAMYNTSSGCRPSHSMDFTSLYI